jgi:hypothetical protein
MYLWNAMGGQLLIKYCFGTSIECRDRDIA